MNDEQHDSLMETGRCAYAAIVEMVTALQCDYDRLEELKDEQEALVDALEDYEGGELADGQAALGAWNAENEEELNLLRAAAGDCESEEDARQRVWEDALSVQVRSGWVSPGEEFEAEEFELLLSTGGPAVRIRGELDQYKEPRRAWLEVQDWGTPWTQYFDAEQDVLLQYARCFWYGE